MATKTGGVATRWYPDKRLYLHPLWARAYASFIETQPRSQVRFLHPNAARGTGRYDQLEDSAPDGCSRCMHPFLVIITALVAVIAATLVAIVFFALYLSNGTVYIHKVEGEVTNNDWVWDAELLDPNSEIFADYELEACDDIIAASQEEVKTCMVNSFRPGSVIISFQITYAVQSSAESQMASAAQMLNRLDANLPTTFRKITLVTQNNDAVQAREEPEAPIEDGDSDQEATTATPGGQQPQAPTIAPDDLKGSDPNQLKGYNPNELKGYNPNELKGYNPGDLKGSNPSVVARRRRQAETAEKSRLKGDPGPEEEEYYYYRDVDYEEYIEKAKGTEDHS